MRVFGSNYILAQYLQTVQSSCLIFINLERKRERPRSASEATLQGGVGRTGPRESSWRSRPRLSRLCCPKAVVRLHLSGFARCEQSLFLSSVATRVRERRAAKPRDARNEGVPLSRLQSRACVFSRVLFDRGLRKKRDCS